MLSIILAQTLAWIPPTERENEEPFGSDEIAQYDVREVCGSVSTIIASTADTSINIEPKAECEYSVRVVDTNGLASNFSSSKTFYVEPPDLPPAPTSGGIR